MEVAPTDLVVLPLGHDEHKISLVLPWYVPTGHVEHDTELEIEPGGQRTIDRKKETGNTLKTEHPYSMKFIWAMSQENLSSGFETS